MQKTAATNKQLDSVKSDFISIASHQLRTPLSVIKGLVSLLLEGSYGEIEAKQRDALKKIYDNNQKLIHLVDDLLNVSRMETELMDFAFHPSKLEDVCQKVVDVYISKAKKKRLYLEYIRPKTDLPRVIIDSDRIKEVISNMLDNAIKYTPKGGVKLKIEKKGGNIRLMVSDTGIGVSVTEMPHLFEKFSRGKNIKRFNVAGIGLGLYVGRFVVESHGGRIWAESDGENKGSRFILELPIHSAE